MPGDVVCPSCRTRFAPREGPDAAFCPRCRAPLPVTARFPETLPSSGSHRVAPVEDPEEVRAARADPRRTVGRFLLLSELGKGGMGVVYRAWDERLRRIVALKMVLAQSDPTALERFQREAEVVARLRHPAIVSLHEVGEFQGKKYIAMDFIDGAPLDRRLAAKDGKEGKKLGFTRGLEVLREVARAVHYAHEQGVIHRDLKPQNIMLDGKDRPYVMDFGLARTRESRSGLTRTGAAIGTPAYMPPEQAEGSEGQADERADVYSLGATLYHVIAGRPPFEGATEVNVLTALLTKEPAPPSSWNRRAAGDLDTICLRCLEKDPAKRYPTAGELADELERYLAGDPIASRPIGLVERAFRRAKRQKLATALAAIALATLVAASVFGIGVAANMRELERASLAKEKELRAKAEKAFETAQGLLARGFIQRAERAAEEGRHREALVCAAKALSMPGLSADDAIAGKVVHFLAREGAWRKPRTFLQPAQLRSTIRALSWSPDGQQVALAEDDGAIRVQAIAGKEPRLFPGHKKEALCVAWSPDGTRIASGGNDRTARIVDASTGKLRLELAHEGPVHGLAWSPSSDRLVTACEDGKLRIFDATTGGVARTLECRNPLRAASFSPDGRLIAIGGFDQTVFVLGLDDPEQVVPKWEHRGEVRCVAWHPKGRLLATCGYDRNVIVWDVDPDRGGKERLKMRINLRGLHQNLVESVAWSPDGTVLATGNAETLVRLIAPQLGEAGDSDYAKFQRGELQSRVTMVFEEHKGTVTSVAFSPDGRRLASAGTDGMLAVWDLEPARVAVLDHPEDVHDLAFSPDGRKLATAGGDRCARTFELSDPTRPVVFPDQGFRVFHLAWSPDARRLAAAIGNPNDGRSPETTIWDLATLRDEAKVPGSTVAWSPDGRWLATSHDAVPMQLRDAGAGFAGFPIPEIVNEAPLGFSPDGRLLGVIQSDRVNVVDVASKRLLLGLKAQGQEGQITSFSWNGKRLATGSTDQTIRIFDVASGKEVDPSPLRSPRACTTAVAWSPDGKWIVSGGPEKSGLVLWDAATGHLVAHLPGHTATINAVAWSPDSRLIASASGDRTVRLWPIDRMLAPPSKDVLGEAERATGLWIDDKTLDLIAGERPPDGARKTE